MYVCFICNVCYGCSCVMYVMDFEFSVLWQSIFEMFMILIIFFLCNFNVQRCTDLKILPLCFRREIIDLLFFFYGLIHVDFSSEFVFINSSHDFRSANDLLLSAQPVRTKCFKSSYFNRIVRLWNFLPLLTRQCTSLNAFKHKVTLFYIDKFVNVDPKATDYLHHFLLMFFSIFLCIYIFYACMQFK